MWKFFQKPWHHICLDEIYNSIPILKTRNDLYFCIQFSVCQSFLVVLSTYVCEPVVYCHVLQLQQIFLITFVYLSFCGEISTKMDDLFQCCYSNDDGNLKIYSTYRISCLLIGILPGPVNFESCYEKRC